MDQDIATVFIIDDDEAICRSLARLIRSGGYEVEAFLSAREFLDRLPFPGVGCVVADVCMPGMTGPELHDRLLSAGISLPMVFLTAHGDLPTGVQAMKKGAVDFLVKPAEDETLLRTIAQAVERHAGRRQKDLEKLAMSLRLARLSPREREIMEYVIGGWLNKQIAAELGISEKTVKVHRSQVMKKMEVRSLAELVRQCQFLDIAPRRIRTTPGKTKV